MLKVFDSSDLLTLVKIHSFNYEKPGKDTFLISTVENLSMGTFYRAKFFLFAGGKNIFDAMLKRSYTLKRS